MTTENILKEMSDAIKLNNESKVTTNEALCHAGNVIRSLEKKIKEECAEGDKRYEQGVKDAWDLACDICCSTAFGGLSAEQLKMVFGKDNAVDVMDNYSYENAKKKMEEFLAKKEEVEEEQIIRGDEVIYHGKSGTVYKGIYLCESLSENSYWILCYDIDVPQNMSKDMFKLTKTGRHIDLGE